MPNSAWAGINPVQAEFYDSNQPHRTFSMRNILIFFTTALIVLIGFSSTAWATNSKIPRAKLCASCHQATPGIMLGFLQDISVDTGMMQIDFISHQESVNFSSDTTLHNIASFADLGNHQQRGIRVTFIVINDEKLATEIAVFDHLDSLNQTSIITKTGLQKIITNQNLRLYDLRSPVEFAKGHLPGAIPLPSPLVGQFSQTLPENHETPLVFYGDDNYLNYAAFIKASSFGYNNVRIYAAGFADWNTTEYTIVDVNWLKQAIDQEIPHLLIDLRPTEDIINGHIRGSVTIADADLTGNITQFPAHKDLPIIFSGPASKNAAARVSSWGYRAVGIIPISFDGWQAISPLVASGPAPALRRNRNLLDSIDETMLSDHNSLNINGM